MTGDETDRGTELLKGAYALDKPDDHRDFYREFAAHYDRSFAGALGYIYPVAIADAIGAARLADGPVLDVGCGTGLVAEAIHKLQTGPGHSRCRSVARHAGQGAQQGALRRPVRS